MIVKGEIHVEPGTIAVISLAIAAGTFFLGRISASRDTGKEVGTVVADIHHIKGSLDRIESRLDKLEDRIEEHGLQLSDVGQEVARARESARSAHHRIDEHIQQHTK